MLEVIADPPLSLDLREQLNTIRGATKDAARILEENLNPVVNHIKTDKIETNFDINKSEHSYLMKPNETGSSFANTGDLSRNDYFRRLDQEV